MWCFVRLHAVEGVQPNERVPFFHSLFHQELCAQHSAMDQQHRPQGVTCWNSSDAGAACRLCRAPMARSSRRLAALLQGAASSLAGSPQPLGHRTGWAASAARSWDAVPVTLSGSHSRPETGHVCGVGRLERRMHSTPAGDAAAPEQAASDAQAPMTGSPGAGAVQDGAGERRPSRGAAERPPGADRRSPIRSPTQPHLERRPQRRPWQARTAADVAGKKLADRMKGLIRAGQPAAARRLFAPPIQACSFGAIESSTNRMTCTKPTLAAGLQGFRGLGRPA